MRHHCGVIGITSPRLVVFIAGLAIGGSDVRPLIDHFDSQDAFLARYEPSPFDQLALGMEQYFRSQMPYRYANDDIVFTRMLIGRRITYRSRTAEP